MMEVDIISHPSIVRFLGVIAKSFGPDHRAKLDQSMLRGMGWRYAHPLCHRFPKCCSYMQYEPSAECAVIFLAVKEYGA